MTSSGRLRSAALAALFLAILILPGLAAVTPERSPAMTALQLPLRFEQNQGQTAAPVRYLARGRGYTLFLTPSEAVLSLQPGKKALGNKASSTSDVIRMRLVKGSPTPRMEALDALPGESNYLIGRNPKAWRRDVPGYGRVAERGVYPGIDLIYYGNQQQLEYDFVVAPNADPSRIVLQMDGASGVTIDRDGNLVLSNHDGSVTLRHPTIYQMENGHRIPVTGHFVRKGKNKVAFHLGAYDHQQQLVIDPVLEYSSYLGGSGNDFATGVAVDSKGFIYVVGGTASDNFPVQYGLQGYGGSRLGNGFTVVGDAFVTKIDPKGPSLVYSTYLGGVNADQANGLALDANGHVFVVGETSSPDFPIKNALQATCAVCSAPWGPTSSAFVTEIDSTGRWLVFSTYLGSSTGTTRGKFIAMDSGGNVYIAGFTESGYPSTPGWVGVDCTMHPAFVSKLKAGGTGFDYSGCLPGGLVSGIGVDAQGGLYVAGYTRPADFTATPGAFQTTSSSDSSGTPNQLDGFVIKVDPTGTRLDYATLLGGSRNEYLTGLAIDEAGDAYVSGYTVSPDFPVKDALQPKCGGCTTTEDGNAFVTELNPSGTGLIFSTYLGGSGDGAGPIALDSSDRIFVAGSTSTNFPAVHASQAPSQDIVPFVAELEPNGKVLDYATPFGINSGSISGMAVDGADSVYLVGKSNAGWPTTSDALQGVIGGPYGSDAFVTIIGDGILQSSTGSLSFSGQAIGTTSAAQTFTLTASGHVPVTVPSIEASGDFAETNNCPATLTDGQSCLVQVMFSPSDVGTRSGVVSISSNTNQSGQTVVLAGTGVAPTATLTPSALAFDAQAAYTGTASPAQTVTLHNAGDGPLTITAVGVSGDFSETNFCGSSLKAGSDCTIQIVFSPTAIGARTGSLTITDNASNSPQSVTLTGTGVAALVQFAPESLDFPEQAVGTASAAQVITLTNDSTATAALNVSSVSVSGDYEEVNNCGMPVAAGSSCTIQVKFSPTANGVRNGTLAILDNSGLGQQTVKLIGTGTWPSVSISPRSLSFGSQTVGAASPAQTIALSNTGTDVLQIAGIGASGDFTESNTCSGQLAAGAQCTISVQFAPTAAGDRSGSLVINDSTGGATIALNGTGSQPGADLAPGVLAFGSEAVGAVSSAQTVTLTNTGTAALGIRGVTASTDFQQTNTCGSSLDAGASCIINVQFAPSAAGSRAGTVTVADDLGTQVVAVSGTGNSPQISLDPATLTFGSYRKGFTSPAQTVTLTNSGTAPLAIAGIVAEGDFGATNDCGASLAAGAHCALNVTFTPTGRGQRTGALLIQTGSETAVVTLTGSGSVTGVHLAPAEVHFGSQPVGTTSPAQTVTVTNTGTGVLTISAITASGDYQQTNTCGTLPAQLPAGGVCSLSITVTPTTPGAITGSIQLATSAGTVQVGAAQRAWTAAAHDATATVTTSETDVIALSADGGSSDLTVSPSSLAFGSQTVGTASAAQTVTVTNQGSSDLTMNPLQVSGSFAEKDTCTGTLAAGATCSVEVTMTPTVAGAQTGLLTISAGSGSGASTATVALSGSGAAPGLSVSPATLSFAQQQVGTVSAAQTVTLTNQGATDLTLTVQTGSDFPLGGSCPTLAAGASCQLPVTFKPTAAGNRTGVLSVTADGGQSVEVALSGSGTAPAVKLSAATLDFSHQPVGIVSAAQTLTVTNAGAAPLTISGISADGDFAATSQCGASLDAGASCTVQVTFKPTAAGSRSGSLQISDDAAGSPSTVALSGSGSDFTLTTPQATSMTAGQSAQFSLILQNQSGDAENLTLSCSGAPTGGTCQVSPGTVALGTDPATVTVSVTTAGRALALPPPAPPSGTQRLWVLGLLGFLLAAGWLWMVPTRRRRFAGAALAGLALLLVLAGCGGSPASSGSGGAPGTPSGSYTLTLKATSASGLSHTVSWKVNVE